MTIARPESAVTDSSPPPPAAAASPAAKTKLGAAPWVASTYFAEGLPFSIVHQMSAQLFTHFGASLSAIGLTSLYHLAWNLKFLWSPFVERAGTTRRWMVGLQLAVGAAVIAMAWPAGRGDLKTVAIALVAVAVLAATQDIAIDGYYLRALDKDAQASLSGLRVVAYRVAMLVGNGALVMLAGLGSWFWCFFVAGVMLVSLGVAHAFWLPRPIADAPSVDGKSMLGGFWAAVRSYLQKEGVGATIAFLLLFRAGDFMYFAMNKPFLKALGLSTALQGAINGTAGTIGSVAGSVLGAMWISKRGLGKTLLPIAIVQSSALLMYAWMAWARPALPAIAVVVVAEQLVAGIGNAGLLVFIMQRSQGEHRTSHFALGTGLMTVAQTAIGSVSGPLAETVGYTGFFALAFVAALPGVVLARFVPKTT